jgi:phosphoinositide-3-kinase regulatory subunit 4
MIKHMIALDPAMRPTFDSLLHTSRATVFEESFYSFLHNYVSSVNDLPTPPPLSPTTSSTPTPHAMGPSTSVSSTVKLVSTTGNPIGAPLVDTSSDALPSDSDHRIERIWADYESVEPYLAPDIGTETVMDVRVTYASSVSPSKAFQVSSDKLPIPMLMLCFQDILPVELHIPNRVSKLKGTLHVNPRAASEGTCIRLQHSV